MGCPFFLLHAKGLLSVAAPSPFMPGILLRCFRCSTVLFLLAVVPALSAQTPAPFTLTPPTPTPAPVFESTPQKVGFVPPTVLKRFAVPYPDLAHLNRVQGVVRVRFSIDETGKVTHAIAAQSSGSIILDNIVRDPNLLAWTFHPATLNGTPVPSSKEMEFEFKLDPIEENAIAIKRLALPVGTPNAPYPKEAIPQKLRGSATVSVSWTKGGLVDAIAMSKSSGFVLLDHAALHWAYENWHKDPATLDEKKPEIFSQTMDFAPPP